MPVELKFDREGQFAIAKVRGELVISEIDALLARASVGLNAVKSIGTLWDLRECDFASFDRARQSELLKVRKKYPERSKMKLAAVVSDNLGFAIMRKYQSLAHVSGIADQSLSLITFDEVEARSWLLEDRLKGVDQN